MSNCKHLPWGVDLGYLEPAEKKAVFTLLRSMKEKHYLKSPSVIFPLVRIGLTLMAWKEVLLCSFSKKRDLKEPRKSIAQGDIKMNMSLLVPCGFIS